MAVTTPSDLRLMRNAAPLLRGCVLCRCSMSLRPLHRNSSNRIGRERLKSEELSLKERKRLVRARIEQEWVFRDRYRSKNLREYVKAEDPRWSRKKTQFGTNDHSIDSDSNYWLKRRAPEERGKEVQCGIFWDLDNVNPVTYPPKIA
jgi:hypothetical protein